MDMTFLVKVQMLGKIKSLKKTIFLINKGQEAKMLSTHYGGGGDT